MAYCPHLSYTLIASQSDPLFPPTLYTYAPGNDLVEDPYLHFVDCLGVKCQQWDTTNGKCGKLMSNEMRGTSFSLLTYLKDLIGMTTDRDSGLPLVKWLYTLFGTKADTDVVIEAHPSDPSAVYTGSRSTILNMAKHSNKDHIDLQLPPPPQPAMDLIGEFMGGTDLDANGLVYGRDFKITDNSDKPTVLKGIEDHEDWTEPPSEQTWLDFLASLP